MKYFALLLLSAGLALSSCLLHRKAPTPPQYKFDLRCTPADEAEMPHYLAVLRKGQRHAETFFGKPFPRPFSVVIHPSRAALDSCWQQDWKMPDFRSECWMVASGVAAKLDVLSPKTWASAACEHRWEDSVASVRLITHEMVHVFHGQHCASPDFSDTDRIDWFVEGLAVYASGQCDSARLAGVRQWLKARPAPPTSLDQFWTGKHKYGLSGSVVMFLDKKLGRERLCNLLVFNKKDDLLRAIGMTEQEILEQWRSGGL